MSGQPTDPGWNLATGWLKHTGTVTELVNNDRAAYTSWLDLGNMIMMVKTHRYKRR